MQITIDTNDLSDRDLVLLGQLVTLLGGNVAVSPAPAEPAKAPKAPKAEQPAPVAEPASEEPTAETDDEDLVGGAPTLADAVEAATKLVSSGGAAKVKAALGTVGAKRVSEMKVEDVPAFLTALDA